MLNTLLDNVRRATSEAVASLEALLQGLRALPGAAGSPESLSVELEFLLPLAFFALPIPLLVALLFRVRAENQRALYLPATLDAIAGKGADSRVRAPRMAWLFALLAWCCLVFAAARPQWVGPPIGSPISGRDLMMCIDISGSMNESDLYSGNAAYTRIDVVRELASDFVQQRTGDRVGLIMFGSQAYVQTPLTFDHQTVAHFIREAQVGLAGRSTAIGDAIGLGVKRLRERPVESRVLVLLTDGANSAGVVDPLEAARVANESDIRIHTIGVGSERSGGSILGFPVPARRSELDETTLIKIAELTGGQYFGHVMSTSCNRSIR